jgi:hypothetical protein
MWSCNSNFLLWEKTQSKQNVKFPCFIISSSLRNWYQPILAYSHHGRNKRLNTYMTKCHTLSAHQTKTQYCILVTDGRHVYTVTANQNIGGMILTVMFDFQTDTVMCKHQYTGLEGFNTRCENNALHITWGDHVFHFQKNTSKCKPCPVGTIIFEFQYTEEYTSLVSWLHTCKDSHF